MKFYVSVPVSFVVKAEVVADSKRAALARVRRCMRPGNGPDIRYYPEEDDESDYELGDSLDDCSDYDFEWHCARAEVVSE